MPSIAPLTADILVTAACWQAEPGAETLVQRAIEAAAKHASTAAQPAEVAIVLTDDSGIRTLNRDWRGIDKPTNVLSFPAAAAPGGNTEPRMLGDIAIAYETTKREASDEHKPFGHHLSHLAVHGFLHLVGYDHENDADAETMEDLERTILKSLGVPDPYA
jgi:probable rRNA maturation factor